MRFKQTSAEIFIPDDTPEERALSRTTHLAVAAHADDIELMASDGILQAFQQNDRWFCGVVATDGGGSPRAGAYQNYTDEQMRRLRKEEQKKAAVIGEYSAVILLDHPSSTVKAAENTDLVEDLTLILKSTKPAVIYTHNLADKHDTHVAVALRLLAAARSLPPADQPQHIFGCEIWRDLDWLCDDEKVVFDLSARENLQAALMGIYDSQIGGGKRYDLAAMARRRAHATFHQSHQTDRSSLLLFAMDLMPLLREAHLTPEQYLQERINRFASEAAGRIMRLSPKNNSRESAP